LKKIFAVFVLSLICASILGGCVSQNMESLNEMAAQNYKQINLYVTTTFSDGTSLIDTFCVYFEENETKISYYIRRFAEIDVSLAEQEQITTTSGVAHIKNDGATEFDGEKADLPFEQIAKIPFVFSSDCFSNVKLTKTSFSASVTNPAKFFGTESFDASNMTVEVIFEENSRFKSVKVSYVADNGTSVNVEYSFAG